MPRRARLQAFAGTTLIIAIASLDQTILATALPTVARDLGDLTGASWLITGYLLTSTASTPVFGRLSDLYGRRRLLRIALVVYLGAALMCSLAQEMGQLIALRLLQGLGGGGLMALGMTLVADLTEPRDRGRYQGYIAGVYGVVSTLGPLLGGILTEQLSWRSVFLMGLPAGVAIWALTDRPLAMLKPVRIGIPRIDYLGAALMVSGVSLFLLTLSWGGKLMPWLSFQTAAMALSTFFLLVLFVTWERRAPVPILPLGLFREPTMRIALPALSLGAMAMFIAIVYMPLQIQIVGGKGAATSGFLLMPLMLGMSFGAWSSGRLVSRTGRYKIYPVLGAGGATLLFLVLALTDIDDSLWVRGILLALIGMGISSLISILVLAVQNTVGAADMGAATSSLGCFRSLGGAVAVAVAAAMLAAGASTFPGGSGSIPQGEALAALPAETRAMLGSMLAPVFDRIFIVAALMTMCSFVLTIFLKEHPIPGAGRK